MILRTAAILSLGLVVAFLAVSSTQRNGGDFTYPLDDSYIHLAVAKNLAAHGTWGIQPGVFSACTSSLAWPLLLALFGAAMPWGEAVPLTLGLLLAAATLVVADRMMLERPVGRLVRAAVLVGFVFVVPLGVLTMLGLEHVAQILLALLLLRWGVERIYGPDPGSARRGRGLVFATLLVAVRFEGLFLVAAMAWSLHRARRNRDAGALLVAGAAPVVIFGAVSSMLGGPFLPVPLWMKGKLSAELMPALRATGPDPGLRLQVLLEFFLLDPLRSLAEVGVLAWLVLIALARMVWIRTRGGRLVDLWIVLATTWMHLTFARTGWVGRYEAWLIAMLIVVVAPFTQRLLDGGPRHRRLVTAVTLLAGLVFIAIPVRFRVATTHFQANRGSTNIHEQHVQAARFLDRFRSGEAVAVNDIGVFAWATDVDVVDLWGLSNRPLAELRVQERINPVEIDWAAREAGARVAAMYRSVLEESGGVPPGWVEVAQWRIHRNAVCGSPRLSWFATSPEEADKLAAQLEAFTPELPPTVDVRWSPPRI